MDIHDPALYDRYYQKLYDLSRPESQNTEMQEAIRRQDFVDVAAKYRIIGDGAVNILVPYDKKGFEGLVKEVHETGLTRSWVAKARPYAISMFETEKRCLCMATPGARSFAAGRIRRRLAYLS